MEKQCAIGFLRTRLYFKDYSAFLRRLDPHERRARIRLLVTPLSYQSLHLLYSSNDNWGYRNAQFSPYSRQIHGKPVKSRLSVDASHLFKVLCVLTEC
jgi:hypothetical protein